jgi:arsenate reductase
VIARDTEAAEEGIDLPRTAEARDAWLEALSQQPWAVQRPIITAADGTTVVGRDPGALAEVVAAES